MDTAERSIALTVQDDLGASGLALSDIGGRIMDSPERSACGLPAVTEGYVIPYFNMKGKRLPFYRVRTFNFEPKYKQPRNTPTYVYYPQRFFDAVNGHNYVVLTEGEKKAACAAKFGFPACALGGVDNWRNRTIALPMGTELVPGKKEGQVIAKLKGKQTLDLDDKEEADEQTSTTTAVGFEDLVQFVLTQKATILLCFDTDSEGIRFEVQRAIAALGFELRFRGIPLARIRQLILPPNLQQGVEGSKLGLDDYLVQKGKDPLQKLIDETLSARHAFPRHPNVRDFINKRLQKTKLSRRESQSVSLAVLSDLDATGIRLRDSIQEEKMYYFDDASRRLMKASISTFNREQVLEIEFARLLYQRYGLSANDNRILTWLATQISSEDPIDRVEPHKVMFADRRRDIIRYQINNGQYVEITSSRTEPARIRDNGHDGILFESGHVQPIDAAALTMELERQAKSPLSCWWHEVFLDTRLKRKDDPNVSRLAALLPYVSPWLNRWRGTQLPIECVIGEAGSGKSTLCSLRLDILMGSSSLRNAPADIKDWHSSVTNTGGIHITDNLVLNDRNLKQRLSDEMCRIVTEPNPHVEQRKYYTNAELIRLPVETVFAITAITQPFNGVDFLQRSFKLELDKGDSLQQDGNLDFGSEWLQGHLSNRGGRTGWIAHHILVLNRFLQLVQERWQPGYRAKYRLVNLEQCLVLMCEVFGWDSSWVSQHLAATSLKDTTEGDWTLEGIAAFARQYRELHSNYLKASIEAADISDWATVTDEYNDNTVLKSSRRVGRYLQANKAQVAQSAGLASDCKVMNVQRYKFIK